MLSVRHTPIKVSIGCQLDVPDQIIVEMMDTKLTDCFKLFARLSAERHFISYQLYDIIEQSLTETDPMTANEYYFVNYRAISLSIELSDGLPEFWPSVRRVVFEAKAQQKLFEEENVSFLFHKPDA